MQRYYPAFSMVESMVVLAIMAIFITTIFPSYQQLLRKAHYHEVAQAVLPLRLSIESCYAVMGDLSLCGPGKQGVMRRVTVPHSSLIHTMEITAPGQIHVTVKPQYGFTTDDDYWLIAHEDHHTLVWKSSGGAVTKGYIH